MVDIFLSKRKLFCILIDKGKPFNFQIHGELEINSALGNECIFPQVTKFRPIMTFLTLDETNMKWFSLNIFSAGILTFPVAEVG